MREMAESGARLVGFARTVREFARSARSLGFSAAPEPSVCQGFSRLGHRPPCSELIFVSGSQRLGATGKDLDQTEPRSEPMRSTSQRSLGVNVKPASHLHPGKKEITNFVFVRILSHLGKFCFDIGVGDLDPAIPVEARRRRLLLDLGRKRQPRQGRRDAIEGGVTMLLLRLDLLPRRHDGLRVIGIDVAEDMRVPGDQLVVHASSNVGDGERSPLRGQPGVEVDLVEQIAELLGRECLKKG